MLRRLLPAAALLLLLTSRAEAATLLLFTVDIYEPTVGPPGLSLNYRFFESASNGWPYSTLQPQTGLATGNAALLPGVTQFNITLNAASLANTYFAAHGFYTSNVAGQAPGFQSIYVAEPPTGAVPDGLAYGYGPPWISLANLGDGLSGQFHYIYGYSRGPIGTWTLAAAADPVAPVPEPASLFLLGSGLAALAGRRYRQSKAR